MAKVFVDESLCTGCGLCESTCPEVFKVENNVAKVTSEDTSSCDIQDAVDNCPVTAITLEADGE
ncbi:MAG: ferredoxin [Candidatus Omnitrophica bacterium]|nr:ferredoxin [Candidatus Omnitrophota bacterium]